MAYLIGNTNRHGNTNHKMLSHFIVSMQDEWREIDINGVSFFGEKTCGRCGLPNIDPDTGKMNPKAEPYNTLYK